MSCLLLEIFEVIRCLVEKNSVRTIHYFEGGPTHSSETGLLSDRSNLKSHTVILRDFG
jgi:hypothetical protein